MRRYLRQLSSVINVADNSTRKQEVPLILWIYYPPPVQVSHIPTRNDRLRAALRKPSLRPSYHLLPLQNLNYTNISPKN